MPTRLQLKKSNHSRNYSSIICKSSSIFLSTLIKQSIYNKYKKTISNITNTFTISQSKLLNEIIHIKDTNKFTITFIEKSLDQYNTVPPFIDIFRYLITKSEFINKFSKSDKTLLQHNLLASHSKEYCYKFLETHDLGQKILDFYYSINHTLKSELIAKFPSIEFHSLLINNFTSFKIIEDLELRIKKILSFSVEWQGKKLENLINIFMYDDMKNIDTITKIGNEIVKRILFFNKFLNIDTLPSKFIIFLTDKKKEIDENVILHMHFKTINVNTAVTNGHDIIIYREQELLKSIFHELIHFHNLDFRQIPDSIIQYLIKTHNIKSDNDYLLYECVTEAMANILNNLFLSSNIKEFKYNLQNELLFSTLQVIKILNVCGYSKWDEFSSIDNSSLNTSNPKTQFKQDSCIMSYYILKFYIMMNLDTYFKKCLDSRLKFIQTTNSFNNLIHIFDLARKNLVIKDIMDNALIKFSNSKYSNSKYSNRHSNSSKKTIRKDNNNLIEKINKTLRMTCLESNLFTKNSI